MYSFCLYVEWSTWSKVVGPCITVLEKGRCCIPKDVICNLYSNGKSLSTEQSKQKEKINIFAVCCYHDTCTGTVLESVLCVSQSEL